ncbi:MAG: dipeptidase [Acidobacteriota bacterium]
MDSWNIGEEAGRLHFSSLVVDTHVDTTQKLLQPGWDFAALHQEGSVDLPRLSKGGARALFFAVYVPGTTIEAEALSQALEQIAAIHKMARDLSDSMALCTNAREVRQAFTLGRIAVLLAIEGGHMINNNLALLPIYAHLGIRYLTLTHRVNTDWADSSADQPRHNGLSAFGKEVIRELNRLGIMIDISHASDKTFWDVLETSQAPIIATHSSCRAICPHSRNLSDEMIKALASGGGIIHITFVKDFIGPSPATGWEKIVEHIDHAVSLVGAGHVGLGSDFDGADMPRGMEDAACLPKITEALLLRGYSEKDTRKILGENTLRVMEAIGRQT